MKDDVKNNFTKLIHRNGISLIVLIVTIIVIVILAAAVIFTISKNNPVEGAKEAKFKEDIRAMQDELSVYLASKYTKDLGKFEPSSLNLTGEDIVEVLPSTEMYKDKVKIENGKLIYIGENKKEKEWAKSILGVYIKDEWKATISDVTYDGVPIPKGFTYVIGTKETGTVIKDTKGNEFVWIPATESSYIKDSTFPGVTPTGEYDLPNGINDEIYDVKKYGGFYIARYEAGIPEGDTSPSNKTGIPVSKKGAIVWTDIEYINAKASAECMISNDYVQTGLLTGKAWDTTCYFIDDAVSSLTDSRTYGNYYNSIAPANVAVNKIKQAAGHSEKWSVKNIYDLAGNVWEWTSEACRSDAIIRGGGYRSSRFWRFSFLS